MYHIQKQTRVYTGEPYCGPTSNNIPAEFNTIEEANKASAQFMFDNPVGWNIFDAETHELVDGLDFFDEIADYYEHYEGLQ